MDPRRVGRDKWPIGRARREERTGVCAEAQYADRGEDRGEVERGRMNEPGSGGVVRRREGWVCIAAVVGEREELERAIAVAGRDKNARLLMNEKSHVLGGS